MTAFGLRRANAAFTLFELLLVIIVLSVLLIVAAPALFNNSLASQLSSAGDLVLNKLSEAQQEAVASNTEVEVRFLEHTNADSLDHIPRLRSFQMLTLAVGDGAEAENGFLPASPRTSFPEGVVISGNEKLTSLVEAGFKADATTASGTQARYLALRFRPDGSTNLPPGAAWFLTILTEDVERQAMTPANFYTIQIDPATGRIRSFRP